MKESVFLSYRRADSAGHAGRIDDDLEQAFGEAVLFRDVEAIDAGRDFVEVLEAARGSARVCIVLLGADWLDARADDGSRRLDDPGDTVRMEIELALSRPGMTVLTVLVQDAAMPSADELPKSLQRLARLQAVELSETRWDYDMSRLVDALRAAGVASANAARMPPWVIPVIAVLSVGLLVVAFLCFGGRGAGIDDYTGLWHMPNGSFWSIREKDDGLWVEETHHESRQVWMRGEGRFDGEQLVVTLVPVFDHDEWRYLHQLRLAEDRKSLIGTVRRADQKSERSLVLTRQAR